MAVSGAFESNIQKNIELDDIQLKKTTIPIRRVLTIDVLKGICIFFVILGHISHFCTITEELWIYFWFYLFLDMFGPVPFVFLSSLSVVYSIKKKQQTMNPNFIKKNIFGRAFFLLVVGFITNYFVNQKFGILSFWYWFVLQTLAFSQIFTYIALKFKPIIRLIIALVILFIITPFLFNFLTMNMNLANIDIKDLSLDDLSNVYAFFYWFIFNPYYMMPFLPWMAIPFIGSIVGEYLFNLTQRNNLQEYRVFAKRVLWIAFSCIIIAIIFGHTIVSDGYGGALIEEIKKNPYIQITGIPEFLNQHTPINLFYNTGTTLLFLAIAFYLCEIKQYNGKITYFLQFLGLYSLTIFVLHPIFGIWFPNKLSFAMTWLYSFIIWIFFYLHLKFLVTKCKARGTLEWLINKLSNAVFKTKRSIDPKTGKVLEQNVE